ncbi:gastrin/cholecystokinin type B receptor-like [Acanthaster planci]|uniref:Gastrin/cholecystokinin type B receptor-like n=1 Tax=Acanthaster planci TaxID=133434 RepID=A0A8B7ZGW7_ACAPL|nr:gastrin/cholecystokinin type B receptor-like [Acanthaster planci]
MGDLSVANSTVPHQDPPLTEEPVGSSGDVFRLTANLIVFLLGVPGNCLILRVYWVKTVKTSTHVLIMALAWADLAVCSMRWTEISMEALLIARDQIPDVLNIINEFSTINVATSVLITSLIAVDRYDCVCRPHSRVFTKKRAKLAVIFAFFLSFIITVPSCIAMFTDLSNAVVELIVLAFRVVIFATALAMIAVCYVKVYLAIRKQGKVGVLSTGGPGDGDRPERGRRLCGGESAVDRSVTVFSVTANLSDAAQKRGSKEEAMGVWSSHREIHCPSLDGEKRNHSRQQPQRGEHPRKVKAASLQRKTTKMLLITSVVFLLTWLPFWTFMALLYEGMPISSTFMSLLYKSTITLYINNAVNPLIYGLANRRFRKDCREVLQKIRLL